MNTGTHQAAGGGIWLLLSDSLFRECADQGLCVVEHTERKQDKMHRKYGAPTLGACQGHILQETISWLSKTNFSFYHRSLRFNYH